MNIQTEKYSDSINRLPKTGQHILAHQQGQQIVVYQAFNHQIADYAVENQIFGGTHYSYNRMSWIKPNFLWMMYRCGWGTKENQERVLAIWVNKSDFEKILEEAVFSSFNPSFYTSHEKWKEELDKKDVRLQWDPDHNPFGEKLARRAIQLGMKGKVLEIFSTQYINKIEDITEFVKQQRDFIANGNLDQLEIPIETIFKPSSEPLQKRTGIE